MSEIQFLATTKPFSIPKNIENNSVFFGKGSSFYVWDLDPYWIEIVQPILTLSYLYEASGLGNKDFWTYIDKYMEVGDVLELYRIPVQQWYHAPIRNVLENPMHITINIGSRTYQYEHGKIKLNEKRWLEELSHRTLVTEHGVTTILNY
ncbi:hypothetical protein [Bacillus suaedae]|uniref:Uncharacterized protein n=1 Tax=Halalkalibacter suaedae TaxID=2822140 RepID=A0A941AQR0_9BACI|nr:hypothetical protein [Bacillus suaedae]MBP3953081.1 hypothetical protein [Bacillus suaedae]